MPRCLLHHDPIKVTEFNPIPIDIPLGIIKIPTEEILDSNIPNLFHKTHYANSRSKMVLTIMILNCQ